METKTETKIENEIETKVVPFGKYKGQPVDILLEDDDYIEWMQTQNWVKQKYRWLFKLIERAETLNETPEHNGFQIRFLDEKYRELVAEKYLSHLNINYTKEKLFHEGNILKEKYTNTVLKQFNLKIEDIEILSTHSDAECENTFGFFVRNGEVLNHLHFEIELYNGEINAYSIRDKICSEEYMNEYISTIGQIEVSSPKFEEPMYAAFMDRVQMVGNADVKFTVTGTGISQHELFIELKPIISEDYMTILRKAKKSSINIVMCDRLDTVSAGLEQIKEIYASDNICFLCSGELQ